MDGKSVQLGIAKNGCGMMLISVCKRRKLLKRLVTESISKEKYIIEASCKLHDTSNITQKVTDAQTYWAESIIPSFLDSCLYLYVGFPIDFMKSQDVGESYLLEEFQHAMDDYIKLS